MCSNFESSLQGTHAMESTLLADLSWRGNANGISQSTCFLICFVRQTPREHMLSFETRQGRHPVGAGIQCLRALLNIHRNMDAR